MLWMLTALATTLVACVAEDEENVCTSAASLCGAANEVQDDQWVGAPKDYAACLVQSGDCSTTAKVECAAAAVDGGGGRLHNYVPRFVLLVRRRGHASCVFRRV